MEVDPAATSQLCRIVARRIRSLPATDWLPVPARLSMELLRSGAYHTNVLVRSGEVSLVARINNRSQWGLPAAAQLAREFAVLKSLEATGVAPIPLALLDGDPPILLESYIDGRGFRYDTDLLAAAVAIAKVHEQPPAAEIRKQPPTPAGQFLIEDARRWLGKAESTAGGATGASLVRERMESLEQLPTGPQAPVLLHTDLIHGNLLSAHGACSIVDWEGARVGPRAWDLAYFLSPVTIRWAPVEGWWLTRTARREFLQTYADSASVDLARLDVEVSELLPFVVVRALAWCLGYEATEDLDRTTAQELARFTDTDYIVKTLASI